MILVSQSIKTCCCPERGLSFMLRFVVVISGSVLIIVPLLYRILSTLCSSFNSLRTAGTRSISSDLQQQLSAKLFKSSQDHLTCRPKQLSQRSTESFRVSFLTRTRCTKVTASQPVSVWSAKAPPPTPRV